MTDVAAAASSVTARSARPYAPGWVNLLTAWIERLPGPTT